MALIHFNPRETIFLLLLTLPLTGISQKKVNQDTINGIVYNVYPFDQVLTTHNSYDEIVKYPKFTNKVYKEYYRSMYIEQYGENYNEREFRKFRRKLMNKMRLMRIKSRKKIKIYKRLSKAIRNNPYPLLEQKYSFEKDVTPSLDPIPDGKYVQYFSEYTEIDKKGNIIDSRKHIAGYFSIKNNLLDGEAVWFNVKGDTMKKGFFANGLKEGVWRLEGRNVRYLNEKSIELYIKTGAPAIDTVRAITTFKGGLEDGKHLYYLNSYYPIEEGFYTKGKKSGEWLFRDVEETGYGDTRKRNRNNQLVTLRYSYPEQELVVKQPIIRTNLLGDEYDSDTNYYFFSEYKRANFVGEIFHLSFPKESDLELNEEGVNSYEGGEQVESYGREEEGMYDEGNDYNQSDNSYLYTNQEWDQANYKFISLSTFIDSIGIVFNYDKTYEIHYPNGQLMVKYEFKDGKLQKEDTIFWDNGLVHDVVEFQTDSNQYIRSVYDYTGKLYYKLAYTDKGAFIREIVKPIQRTTTMIGQYLVTDFKTDKYFVLNQEDTLKSTLSDSLLLFQTWYKLDTSIVYSLRYSPKERQLTQDYFSIDRNNVKRAVMNFSEDFESWTGVKNYQFGALNLKTTSSATIRQYIEKDSIPQRNVAVFASNYDETEDHQLFLNDRLFSGKFTLTTNGKKFDVSTGKSIKINLPRASKLSEKLNKDFETYLKTGKTAFKLLHSVIDASEFEDDFSRTFYNSFMSGILAYDVEFPESQFYETDYDDEENRKYNEKKESPFTKRIEGNMVDGRPQGTWKIFDQFGKIMTEISYEKGLIHGTVKEYKTQDPKSPYAVDARTNSLRDSLPTKSTHYLYSTSNYKNGYMDGYSTAYSWYGSIERKAFYKDGYQEGEAFERNPFVCSTMNFKEGELDGYYRTYLTLKGKDSILLYNLNFQNGLLQGESNSYHTNGKLAKRGFFLNGNPIDDYEAYDTLGFKYHYVKFQYSYPVEEKIWEENQLSVRYQFDWRDSISFHPDDITTTQSLENLIGELGLGGDEYYQPYYGRPSIVEKEGINYSITKYYPNDSIARDGLIHAGKKIGCWHYYSYEGEFMYEVDYNDSIITLNDSIQFKSKGVLTDYNAKGEKISESFIIEKMEKYDCSHTDHYEIRQLYTTWQGKDTLDRIHGYVKNYYDNGVLQNEGNMKDGLPTGVWKFYDPFGKLNQVGVYVMGKRDGRWLGGDLSKTKYLGDICLNPNLPNLEEEIKYRENLLDITITNYKLGKALNKEFYDVDMNPLLENETDNPIENQEEGE